MWKWAFRVIFWGGITVMVAPEAVGKAIMLCSDGLGKMVEGAAGLAGDHMLENGKVKPGQGMHPHWNPFK